MVDNNLHKTERIQRILVWILPPFIVFLALTFVLMNQNQSNLLGRNRQDQMTQVQAITDSTQFITYLNNHPTELQLIQSALPNEQMMGSFVADLQDTVRAFDPAASVSFTGTQPVRVGADLVIPIVVKCSAPLEKLPEIMLKIRNLPYVMHMTTVEVTKTDKGGEYVLGYKLFVQEPFTGF